MLAGPLLDHGFQVDLIDAARDRLADAQVVEQLGRFQPDAVLVGHSASTKAHPACLRLLRAVKDALPQTLTVYGGVHPTFHFQEILAEPSAEGKRGQAPFVRSTLRAVPANGACPQWHC